LLVSAPVAASMLILSDGTNGTPRQVTKGVPNRVIVGGGTPRRVHSRPKAAIARGWARKKLGSFQTLVRSSSMSSGVGGPFRVRMRWVGATFERRPYSELLISSLSCFSFTPSIKRRNCS